MTKYILNSGGINNSKDKGKAFFNEIIKDLSKRPKVLFCFFAQPREVWEKKFQDYSDGFTKLLPNDVKPIFSLAFPKTFVKQLKECDAVYIHGGDYDLLVHWLQEFNLPKDWEGKVVATSSASSMLVSKYYWTCDWRESGEGYGIIPAKIIPHYKSHYGDDDPRGPIDWEKAYEDLEAFDNSDLPILALKEGEYRIFEE